MGQIALITGGGRGLGRATAQELAAAGATVVLAGRTEQTLGRAVEEITADGGHALAFPADVGDPQAVAALHDQVIRAAGPVDILVNNAALITPIGVPWQVDPDAWWRTFEVNVRGPFLCSRAVLPGMVERHRGRIVNVISAAVSGDHPYGSAYANSKSAVAHLTRSLARAAVEYGVFVFAVDPGSMTTETGMQQLLTASVEGQRYYPSLQRFHAEARGVPPQRSAQLITALAAGSADALTGRIISVHDDLDILVSRADEIVRDNLYVQRIVR